MPDYWIHVFQRSNGELDTETVLPSYDRAVEYLCDWVGEIDGPGPLRVVVGRNSYPYLETLHRKADGSVERLDLSDAVREQMQGRRAA